MEIQSKYFGEIEIQSETIIEMIQPIYGFESLKQFTLISDQEIGTDLLWFQSLEQVDVCFMVANPFAFVKDVNFDINQNDLKSVEADDREDIDIFSIVSLGETFEQSTLNLKSPILLNVKNNKGAQIILNQELPFRASLV
jgi:flagellar assembly factor FliW